MMFTINVVDIQKYFSFRFVLDGYYIDTFFLYGQGHLRLILFILEENYIFRIMSS